MDQFIQSFAAPDTFTGSLERFAFPGGSSPSGDHEKNLERVRQSRRDTPLHFLVTQIIVDDEGRTITKASDDAAADRLELLMQEGSGINVWSHVAVRALDAILAKHGQPTEAQLVQFLTRGVMSPRAVLNIARAFAHYFRGDYEASAHIALPQVEATVRELCKQAGIPVSRESVRDNGGVASLGTLLHALDKEKLLEKSWIRYLTTALSEVAGLNLRNRIAHGLHTGSDARACASHSPYRLLPLDASARSGSDRLGLSDTSDMSQAAVPVAGRSAVVRRTSGHLSTLQIGSTPKRERCALA